MPVDVPLPERQAAHGPRAQLHHRRRDRALPAHAGQERAAADGLGRLRHAGGKRRDAEPGRPRRLDLRQHRLHEDPAEEPGPGHRLVARSHHLQAGLLPLGAVAVHPPVREGRDLPQERHRQLGPGGPDRAGQRAGDRRPRLALRRAGGKARDPDVLLQDHRLCG
ncbi:hypothetical protein D3C86_1641480 [compost metagenome]